MFRWDDVASHREDQDARHRHAELPEVRGVNAQLRTQWRDHRQCVECRGVFLDRGELDHLIDAETSHYRSRSASSRPDYDKAAHDGSRGLGGRKRGGFLSELFE
jgi:Zn-finger nucleic acid-binding protein